ncbi:unnamed protein product [Allacma fusca]|uniref:Uncharacterized protein n=1 Tax=Allacma fusca TaxID=39272 RepID=A0A8J2JWR5_9HEXA|nr:unnamed protein product [Allacma fusca]
MCDFEEQIRRIIDVLTIALRCSQSSRNQSDYRVGIENALGNLNLSALLEIGIAKPTHRSVLTSQRGILRIMAPLTNNFSTTDSTPVSTSVLQAFNGTDSTGSFPTMSTPSVSTTTPMPMLKLHRLELIKIGKQTY